MKVGHSILKIATLAITFSLLWMCTPKETTVTVTFDSMGGSLVNSRSLRKGTVIGRITEPSKGQSRFLGWYLDNALYDLENTPVENNITLNARWEDPSYTVKYDSRGGQQLPDLVVKEGESALPEAAPQRAGYTFVAWHTKRSIEFSSANEYKAEPISENITLYAEWQSTTKIKSISGGSQLISRLRQVVPDAFQGADNRFDTESPAVQSLVTLNLSGCQAASFDEVSYFTNLLNLDLSTNQITTLDLSKNANLRTANLKTNALTNLIVNNPLLTQLECDQNPNLKTIGGLGTLVRLETFTCSQSGLEGVLDLTALSGLRRVDVSSNRLTEIDASQNENIEQVAFSQPMLTRLRLDKALRIRNTTDGFDVRSGITNDNIEEIRVSASVLCTPGLKSLITAIGSSQGTTYRNKATFRVFSVAATNNIQPFTASEYSMACP